MGKKRYERVARTAAPYREIEKKLDRLHVLEKRKTTSTQGEGISTGPGF